MTHFYKWEPTSPPCVSPRRSPARGETAAEPQPLLSHSGNSLDQPQPACLTFQPNTHKFLLIYTDQPQTKVIFRRFNCLKFKDNGVAYRLWVCLFTLEVSPEPTGNIMQIAKQDAHKRFRQKTLSLCRCACMCVQALTHKQVQILLSCV